MLTLTGGLIIAGTIGLGISLGWALAAASDRYASRWGRRLFGILIVISTLTAAF